MDNTKISEIVNRINDSLLSEGYSGFDPYDALNSSLVPKKNKWVNIILTQFFVYSPFASIRYLAKIPKSVNPKVLGLMLGAYSKQIKLGSRNLAYIKLCEKIVKFLLKHRSKYSSNLSWGHNFPWQSSNRYLERNLPTSVNSCFIGHSLIDLYNVTQDSKYLVLAESISKFLIKDLNVLETENGICFSYTPIDEYYVHNANLLTASFFIRLFEHTKNSELLELSIKSADFSLLQMSDSGLWPYSFDQVNFKHRNQADWHQGFVLDSIYEFVMSDSVDSSKYLKKLEKGAHFYSQKMFDKRGKALWRYPSKWPLDIHNQCQGVITFSKLSRLDDKYFKTLKKITTYMINEMYHEEKFIYQKWPFMTNDIAYPRWCEAWPYVALTEYLYTTINYE